MKIIFLIALMSTFYKQSACSSITRWTHLVTKICMLNPRPYQVVILAKDNRTSETDSIFTEISYCFPTIVLDAESENPNIRFLESSSLYILLQSRVEESILHLNDILPFSAPRPRYLLILLGDEPLAQRDVWKLLQHTCSQKYLDFSIVTNNIVWFYNCFRNSFDEESLNLESTQLFPDKLNNLYGYHLRIPLIDLPPNLTIINGTDGNPRQDGLSFEYLKIFASMLNLTFDFERNLEKTLITTDFAVLFEKLKTGELNFLTMPLNARSVLYNFLGSFTLGKLFFHTNYIILVPIIESSLIDIPLDLIFYLPMFVVIVITFAGIARVFNISKRHWNFLKVYQLLLGIPLNRQPQKTAIRIFYLTIVVLSMTYSVFILSKLIDVKLLKSEVAFSTLDEIDKSNLPLFTFKFIYENLYSYLDDDDGIWTNLQPKTRIFKHINECLDILLENQSSLCITSISHAVHLLRIHKGVNGLPVMKVAKPTMYVDVAAFAFERASPFARRFDTIVQKIVESGIADEWSTFQKTSGKNVPTSLEITETQDKTSISKSFFLLEILAILAVGFFSATLSFIVERWWK